MTLTGIQRKFLMAVANMTDERGIAPSIREVAAQMGHSISTVHYHVENMRAAGIVSCGRGRRSGITIIKEVA